MQEKRSNAGILFRFRRPAGVPKKPPSRAMTEALERLSEAEEMRFLTAKAVAQNRIVVVEVFHSSDGHPLLIHVAALPQAHVLREVY